MLSTKEISDYLYGRAGPAETQHFTFSGLTTIGDALITRWHTITNFPDAEPRLTGKFAPTAKANKIRTVFSRLRIRFLGKLSATNRNILLIMLFFLVFAVTFGLASWRM